MKNVLLDIMEEDILQLVYKMVVLNVHQENLVIVEQQRVQIAKLADIMIRQPDYAMHVQLENIKILKEKLHAYYVKLENIMI